MSDVETSKEALVEAPPVVKRRNSIQLADQDVEHMTKEDKQQLYKELGSWERAQTWGVMNFLVTIIIAVRWPQYYWVWHCIMGFVWLSWRFVRFKARGWEWYMLDFCYVNTYLAIIGCILAFTRVFITHHETVITQFNWELLRAAFAFGNGSLIWAVIMFGNKLVFHDVDNTCSVYIHFSPGIFLWTLRWGGGYGASLIANTWQSEKGGLMFHICRDLAEADLGVSDLRHALWYDGPCAATFKEMVTIPVFVYIICWGIPYYLIVFCCFRNYLDRNDKAYLYLDTIADTKFMGRFILLWPESLRPVAYMVQHFVFTICMGLLSILMWNSFAIHTGLLLIVLLYAVHNGSHFMFRVVALKKLPQFVKAYSRVLSEKKDGESIGEE